MSAYNTGSIEDTCQQGMRFRGPVVTAQFLSTRTNIRWTRHWSSSTNDATKMSSVEHPRLAAKAFGSSDMSGPASFPAATAVNEENTSIRLLSLIAFSAKFNRFRRISTFIVQERSNESDIKLLRAKEN